MINHNVEDLLSQPEARDIVATLCEAFHPDTEPAARLHALVELAIGLSTSPQSAVEWGGAMCGFSMALAQSDHGRATIEDFRAAVQEAALKDGKA